MKLGIQYSCPVKWDQLKTLEDKTRFCDLCSKRIYDFQIASDCEIEEIMKGEGSVCAKVPVSKLEQSITPFQKVLLALVICFSGTLFKVDFAYGQEVENQVIQKDTVSGTWKITGKVIEESTGEELIGCRIFAIGVENGYALSGIDGHFSIDIPETVDSVLLCIEFIGYKEVMKEVRREGGGVDLGEIVIKDEMEIMIGIIIDIDPDSGYEKNSIEYLFQKEKSLPGF